MKAREVEPLIVKQLIDETTPEELNKIDKQMSNNKQTAVEWLANEIKQARILCDDSTIEMDIWHTLDVLIKKSDQAKEMEKEQISDAWYAGDEDGPIHDFEDYYQETFKIN